MEKNNPTILGNVLNALDVKEKSGHWYRPPKDFGPDNPKYSDYNRNTLTDPGDLSMISFTEEFAFGDNSFLDETDCDNKEVEVKTESVSGEVPSFDDSVTTGFTTIKSWVELTEGKIQDETIHALEIAGQAHYQQSILLCFEKMKLEDEYKKIAKARTQSHYENYLKKLKEIDDGHKKKLFEYVKERDERIRQEEIRLRKLEEEATETAKKAELEYLQFIQQTSSEMLKLVADAERREEDEKKIMQGLINDLHTMKFQYVEKLEYMKQIMELNEEHRYKSVEAKLNEVVTDVEHLLESGGNNKTLSELTDKKEALQMNLKCIESVIEAIELRKQEKEQNQRELVNQQPEVPVNEVSVSSVPQIEQPNEVSVVTSHEENNGRDNYNDHKMAVLLSKNRIRYEDLKKKMANILNAQTELDNEKKKDIGRIMGIINQLDVTNQNVNRDKLQKILTFLSGNSVLLNNKRYCANNDPILLASFKSKLMSHILKMGHDIYAKKCEKSVAAYAWLVVSLVSVHQDLWEIFLYHAYTTCPYLVPLYIFKEEGQSDQEFDAARGIRPKEKNDAYTSRMGTCALFFGLILTKMSKYQNMPEHASVVGWKLLAGILTLHPTPGVSAVVLEGFLSGAGAFLQQVYGKQFTKILDYIINVYLPSLEEGIEAVTGGESLLNQLKVLLENYKSTGKIKKSEYIDKFN